MKKIVVLTVLLLVSACSAIGPSDYSADRASPNLHDKRPNNFDAVDPDGNPV